MLILTFHRWEGFHTDVGLWKARTWGFVTFEILGSPTKIEVVKVHDRMRRFRA